MTIKPIPIKLAKEIIKESKEKKYFAIIEQLCEKFEISSENKVRILLLVKKASDENVLKNKWHISVIGGLFYLATHLVNYPITQENIVNELNVSSVSVGKHFKFFNNWRLKTNQFEFSYKRYHEHRRTKR